MKKRIASHRDLEPIRKPLTPSPSPRKRGEGSRFSDATNPGADDA
jgi:hypothetical protein